MKKIILILFALFVAQSTFAQIATDKNPVGTKYVYESEAGGLKLSFEQTLLSVKDGVFTYLSKQELPQPFGSMEFETSYVLKDGVIAQSVENKQKEVETQLSKMGAAGAKVTIEGELNSVPLNGKVGDEFELSSFTINMIVMGTEQKIATEITSYKVIAEETIEIPAGKFDTFVVEAVGETNVSVLGQTKKMVTNSKFWIAKGMGVVKSVTDDGSGQLATVTLQSIVLP